MKLFWIIIGLFSVIAIAMAATQLRRDAGALEQVRATDDAGPMSRPTPRPAQPDSAPTDAPADAAAFDDEQFTTDDDDDVLAGALVDDLLSSADQDESDQTAGPTAPPMPPGPGSAALPDASGDGQQHSQAPPRTADNPWMAAAEDGDTEPRLASSVVEQDDGSLLVDGVFELRGEGTADDPYVVTWDYLMSAAETYQPRLGMTEIPERIQRLDGKHVRIAGYLLFPTAAMEATECLVMLNMWDGCCIGVMPTPYDAIEVQLTRPVSAGTRRYMNYGTIEGELTIDPYLMNDWLIGLYLMEGAELNVGM